MSIFAHVVSVEQTLLGPVFVIELRSGDVVVPLLVAIVRLRGNSVGAECGHTGFLVGTPLILGKA
ncbi:hypothetical protein BH09MYX1_BH09MYX1_41690 [soil metagenome]